MTDSIPRVVLDTVVFIQALISGSGPASRCIDRLRAGHFILLMSNATLNELKDVSLRSTLTSKYPLITPQRVGAFVAEIERLAVQIANPPRVLRLPRDPNDEPFIDLAAAGIANFIVTWNEKHLTYLMRQDTPEGTEFCARFPGIKIITPPDFILALAGH